MADEIPIRSIDEAEIPAFREAIAVVFAFEPREDDREVFTRWLELDRSMVAVDDGQFVATGGAISYRMVVPGGGIVDAAGLTLITVHPTHRRRGLLRRMIQRHFDDAADRGEPVSILWASESSIYGRFGYGLAVEGRDLTIARAHGRMRNDVPDPVGVVRLHSAEEARPMVERVYRAATIEAGVPGSIERREPDWEGYFRDLEHHRDGASRLHFAVYGVGDELRGYVRYRLKSSWGSGGPEGTVVVRDIQAIDGEAYAALWRYLLSIDLMVTVKAEARPVDDPVYRLLADPRRIEESGYDAIWARVLDVEAALSARRYSIEGTLVIEVVDDMVPAAGGRFRLEGGPRGATCERTDAAADLTIAGEHLGAAYLGAPHLATLGWLGLAAGDGEALRLADSMFRWNPGPHTSVHF